MNEKQVKQKAVSGFAWTFMEKMLSQGVGLVVGIILARLIAPEAYGLIAIVQVVTSLVLAFAQSGIASALIQKKEVDEADYSTSFILCLTASVLLYVVLFFAAPWIAAIYENEAVTLPLRVMGLTIILSAYNSVQQAYVSRNMQFRKFFYATAVGTIVSGVIGIYLAYQTQGIWALVAQSMIAIILNTVILFFMVPIRPKLVFSVNKMKEIYRYGSKILCTSLLHTVYWDIMSLLIGKRYSTTDLAYYQKGQRYPKYLYDTLLSSMAKVLFPVMAQSQDNQEFRLQIARRSVQLGTYLLTPILLGFAAISNQFVCFFLTDKWMPCVPFLIMQCVLYVVQPIKTACFENLKAVGKVSIYLRQELWRKAFDIFLVGLSFFLINEPIGIMYALVFAYYVTTLIDIALLKRYAGYQFKMMLKDIVPNYLISGVMAAIVYLVGTLEIGMGWLMLIQILVGIFAYLILSYITKNTWFGYILEIVKIRIKPA